MTITLRLYQSQLIDLARGSFATGHHAPLVVAPTGSGKCLGRGTPVMLHDGSVHPVETIKVGDLLMGPDSKPRSVLSVCTGEEMLYRVTPIKGDPYVVNESHILSLKLTPAGGGERVSARGRMFNDGEIVNLSIKEYLASSRTFKHRAKGWRVGIDFAPSQTPLLLEPYFLGAWLGDGTSKGACVTTGDSEIIVYIKDYSRRLGGTIRVEENSPGSVNVHMIEYSRTGRGGTRIMNSLRFYRLIHNKHIPREFLTASREDRLQLLAGILDTDGYNCGKGFDLTLSSEMLMDGVIFLARSLGFSCYKSPCRKKCHNNGAVGDYYRISINGPVDQVPCLVARKKAAPRQQKKDPLVTGVTVEPIGRGEYFGFEIDGPDRLFLLGDFTVTHNTVIFADICRGAVERKNRVLVIVHRREIMEQTRAKLYDLGVTAGQIAPGRPPTADMVQVAMIQTLVRRLSTVRRPDLIVLDEAHHCVSQNSHGRALSYWKEVPRLGFTATPTRLSGEGLNEMFDDLILGPTIAELVKGGFLSYPVLYAPPGPIQDYHVRRGDFDTDEQQRAMSARAIVGDVIQHYRRHFTAPSGEALPAICFCVNVEHSKLMARQFSDAGYSSLPVYGDMPDTDRQAALDGLREGRVQVVTSCDLISEGFDTPAVAGVILLRRTMSLGLYLQQVGRSLRPFPGKTRAIILDHAGNYALHGHVLAERRWSLDSTRRDPRKEKPPETTSCPRCYGVWPGSPKKCPACGYEFALAPEHKGRDFRTIEGELVEAMPDLPSQDAASMAAFLARAQNVDGAALNKMMLGKAFELAPGGEEGRRRLALLAKAVGRRPGWVNWATRFVKEKRGA
jgi:superfamily II DNA or RNA helicase